MKHCRIGVNKVHTKSQKKLCIKGIILGSISTQDCLEYKYEQSYMNIFDVSCKGTHINKDYTNQYKILVNKGMASFMVCTKLQNCRLKQVKIL